MRQLFPIPREVIDPTEAYATNDRDRSPWIVVNMISTVDGATAIAGRSGGLGGPADKRVFAAIRSIADVILVGAGTVRAENYGPPRTGTRLAIVTASLDLDPGARVFSDNSRPMVFTTTTADDARRAALETVAEVIAVNDGPHVDLGAAIARLDGVVVCEGGPTINGHLVAGDLVDEMCLTVSPLLAGGRSPRAAHGRDDEHARDLALVHVLEEDELLFLRYVRSR